MSNHDSESQLPLDVARLRDQRCDAFRRQWNEPVQPRIEDRPPGLGPRELGRQLGLRRCVLPGGVPLCDPADPRHALSRHATPSESFYPSQPRSTREMGQAKLNAIVQAAFGRSIVVGGGKARHGVATDDSIAGILGGVCAGDEDAVRALWDRYFPRLVLLAGNRFAGRRLGAADGEDVAISVMESFFRAARGGRFPDLRDADGIWRLLSTMTRRKVVDYARRIAARPAVGESAMEAGGLSALASPDPSPVLAALVADEIERLFAILPPKYHETAMKKLEGMTDAEIAQHCGVHTSTVERRLRIIRETWVRALNDSHSTP